MTTNNLIYLTKYNSNKHFKEILLFRNTNATKYVLKLDDIVVMFENYDSIIIFKSQLDIESYKW